MWFRNDSWKRARTTSGAGTSSATSRRFMWRDDAYLLDMLIAARKAAAFSNDLTQDALQESDLHQNAIVYVMQTIGEAATKVSAEFREQHPEIDWAKIIGM